MKNAKSRIMIGKAQSAMEYLMTYGWAILVIAIVLAAFFYLGIFNTAFFEPRAQPGSCQVFRPYGIENREFINLEGECNGYLPEYVMESKGIGDFIIVKGSNYTQSPMNILGNEITITAWVYIHGSPYHDIVDKEGQYGMKIDYNNYPHNCSPSDSPGICLEWDTLNNWTGQSRLIPNGGFNQWMFVAVSMNKTKKYWYANGQNIGNETINTTLSYVNSSFVIGAISPGYAGYGEAEWFNGSIADVQVYNITMTSSDINQIYLSGIGGAPAEIYNLVGWWPLNGNANDYSGDYNNGIVYNMSYFGTTWASSYAIP
jgi:hypothetical protein